VDIKQCEGSIEVFCRLLSGFVGESHCEISYGRDPTGGHLPFFDTSEERGTRGDVLTIKLSHPLETNATYSFNLTIFNLNTAVKVFGTFTTGNPIPTENIRHVYFYYMHCPYFGLSHFLAFVLFHIIMVMFI